ncbi:MAG: FAD-dependent monooxygenase [Burkholderiaceae bacterium]|jgi:2-polyprenyl-6-methoxyphenol hydroxylase-like FAD-dependent oxidoreductase|nr:FAD-dependent monooxygenase [Burkholderiaceae bacterium]
MVFKADVCIRGAGIVGRTLALLLARERLRVALVTSPAPDAPPDDAPLDAAGHGDVRAYALNAASRALLESLRCWPAPLDATPVLEMRVQGDRQGALRFSATAQGVQALGWIVDVPALERLLIEATGFQAGIAQVPQAVAAPLTVVCEGRASQSRAELGVDFEVTRYPHQAIATRLECELPHGQTARQWFTPEGEILAFLPLGGPYGRKVAVVWSVMRERAAALMALDGAAFAEALLQISGAELGPLRECARRASWPLQVAQASHWVGQMPQRPQECFALAGDAAHAMHPLAGQGLNVGLGDVAELARVLAARQAWRGVADLRVLRHYERARKLPWLRMKMATDGLQQLFAHPAPAIARLRNWGLLAFDRCGPVKSYLAQLAMENSGHTL